MKEIDRRCFASLNHDKGSHYVILIDGWFEEDIWADNHTDACQQFREWLRKRNQK